MHREDRMVDAELDAWSAAATEGRGGRVAADAVIDAGRVERLSARAEVDDLCHRFLSNPVIEDATVTLTAVD